MKHPSEHFIAKFKQCAGNSPSLDIFKERHRATMPTNCPILPSKYFLGSDKWISAQLDKK